MSTEAAPAPTETRAQSLAGILIAGPAPTLGILAGLHLWPGPVGNALYMAGKGALYLTPLVWWLLVRRRRFPVARPPRGSLREGVLVGVVLGALIIAAYFLFGRSMMDPARLRVAAAASGFDTPMRYVVMATCICLLNALLEEYAFRWFLYSRCRALLGTLGGALLGALLFTAHHVLVLMAYFEWPIVLLGSFGVFVGGLIWQGLYERRGSVWPAYVSHMIVDVALMAIGASLLFG
jgi:membrane protease YdiL (CAAX protease family)